VYRVPRCSIRSTVPPRRDRGRFIYARDVQPNAATALGQDRRVEAGRAALCLPSGLAAEAAGPVLAGVAQWMLIALVGRALRRYGRAGRPASFARSVSMKPSFDAPGPSRLSAGPHAHPALVFSETFLSTPWVRLADLEGLCPSRSIQGGAHR